MTFTVTQEVQEKLGECTRIFHTHAHKKSSIKLVKKMCIVDRIFMNFKIFCIKISLPFDSIFPQSLKIYS